MGQAKARGTRDQRIAQAVERERIEAERRSEEHRALMQRQREARQEQARKEGIPPVLVADSPSLRRGHTMALMAALAASGAMAVPILTLDESTKRRYRR